MLFLGVDQIVASTLAKGFRGLGKRKEKNEWRNIWTWKILKSLLSFFCEVTLSHWLFIYWSLHLGICLFVSFNLMIWFSGWENCILGFLWVLFFFFLPIVKSVYFCDWNLKSGFLLASNRKGPLMREEWCSCALNRRNMWGFFCLWRSLRLLNLVWCWK